MLIQEIDSNPPTIVRRSIHGALLLRSPRLGGHGHAVGCRLLSWPLEGIPLARKPGSIMVQPIWNRSEIPVRSPCSMLTTSSRSRPNTRSRIPVWVPVLKTTCDSHSIQLGDRMAPIESKPFPSFASQVAQRPGSGPGRLIGYSAECGRRCVHTAPHGDRRSMLPFTMVSSLHSSFQHSYSSVSYPVRVMSRTTSPVMCVTGFRRFPTCLLITLRSSSFDPRSLASSMITCGRLRQIQ